MGTEAAKVTITQFVATFVYYSFYFTDPKDYYISSHGSCYKTKIIL